MDQKVLIAVPTAEVARKARFYDALNALELPKDGITIKTSAHGQSPAQNRNVMIEQAQIHKCSHIMFIDDDTLFPSNMLIQLLSHNVDVVTGMYLMRNYPHQPIIFDESLVDGRCRFHYLSDNETGLIPIVNCGLGACLIKMHVFDGMEKPYIRLGELQKDHWCDDIGFFNRLRATNPEVKIYCDLDMPVGHMGHVTLWPKLNENGKWTTLYDTEGAGTASVAQITLAEAAIAEKKLSDDQKLKLEFVGA